jgi:uncharacterized protein YjiS (DUF1127 family)
MTIQTRTFEAAGDAFQLFRRLVSVWRAIADAARQRLAGHALSAAQLHDIGLNDRRPDAPCRADQQIEAYSRSLEAMLNRLP